MNPQDPAPTDEGRDATYASTRGPPLRTRAARRARSGARHPFTGRRGPRGSRRCRTGGVLQGPVGARATEPPLGAPAARRTRRRTTSTTRPAWSSSPNRAAPTRSLLYANAAFPGFERVLLSLFRDPQMEALLNSLYQLTVNEGANVAVVTNHGQIIDIALVMAALLMALSDPDRSFGVLGRALLLRGAGATGERAGQPDGDHPPGVQRPGHPDPPGRQPDVPAAFPRRPVADGSSSTPRSSGPTTWSPATSSTCS